MRAAGGVRADPRLRSAEILRVPRIGNPAAMTPDGMGRGLDLTGTS